jgi:hypothetical protein
MSQTAPAPPLQSQGVVLDGPLYRHVVLDHEWDERDQQAVISTVSQLITVDTTARNPGMLLGKIQSGKTRAFLGVIALALDSGYDLAVILTKGTKALAKQTVRRVNSEFQEPVADHRVRVFDVMEIPQNLAPAELRAKIILVVKKEDDNLRRLERFLFNAYPELGRKRILMVDDEADFASIGFRRRKGQGLEPAVLMALIDNLRSRMDRLSYLQVTATPYSLYLQPDDAVLSANGLAMPTRPAFTVLLRVHERYVGGEVYFEESQEPGTVASFLFVPVPDEELQALRKPDGRRLKLDEVLTSPRCARLRRAMTGFVMGSALARKRDVSADTKPRNYSFVIHTEQKKGAHAWQEQVVRRLVDDLRSAAEYQAPLFERLMREAYDEFQPSIEADDQVPIPYESALEASRDGLDSMTVQVVNSEQQSDSLLDQKGQLHLRNMLNVFIGGQILDRGLTIENMIGFYYGRNPQKFQQDTVLQHSRMYGPRDRRDLPVTRFYTSPRIYEAMRRIHEMDSALREQIRTLGHDGGVVFIQRRGNAITSCNPNKIRLSKLTTLAPGKRLIPVGFRTEPKSRLAPQTKCIDLMVARHIPEGQDRVMVEIGLQDGLDVVRAICPTLIWDEVDMAYKWDQGALMSALEYTASMFGGGRVLLFVRRSADSSRLRAGGRFQNSPETGDREVELAHARRLATKQPLLVLLRHNGSEAQGWAGGPFWWPILYAPTSMNPVVYCADAYEDGESPSLK